MSAAAHPAMAWTGDGHLDRPARRIVSLLPSATEIVCALGLEDRLVGVTHECDFPPDALAGLPRLTADRLPPGARRSGEVDAAVRSTLSDGHGIYALDEAAVAALEPDVVLTQELCSVCAVAYPTVLRAARSGRGTDDGPLVVSLEPHSLADVLATIGLVARLTGVPERGERLVAELEHRLASVEKGPTRRVALVEWLDPPFAPGHWVPEQIECAGGASVLGRARERSREASWEALAAANPEVVVLGLCGFDLPRTLEEWRTYEPPPAALRQTRAWRNGAIWAIDGSAYVSRPGPRLVDGVEILAAILAGREDVRRASLRQVTDIPGHAARRPGPG